MLGFQAEATPMMIDVTGFAGDIVFHKITGIKLYAGLGGIDFQRSTGFPFTGPGGQTASVRTLVQDPVVIVALGDYQLLIVQVNSVSNSHGLGKVERSVFYGSQFAGGDQRSVDRTKPIGIDHQLMV